MRRRRLRFIPPTARTPVALTSAPSSSSWRRLALTAVMALLAPGLAIGALRVNDILSADLLPGSLFLREGPLLDVVDADVNATAEAVLRAAAGDAGVDGASNRTRVGNWTDAFLTMDFHRKMINEYLCRSYVAEQILEDVVEPAPDSAPEPGPAAAGEPEALANRLSSTLRVAGRDSEGRDSEGRDSEGRDSEGRDIERRDSVGRHGGESPHKWTEQRSSEKSIDPTSPPPSPPTDTKTPRDVPRAVGTGRRRTVSEPRGNLPMFRQKASTSEPRRRRRRRRRKKKTNTRRTDPVKDNMLSDEGSSAYKDWLARTTLLEDIYRHYDHIAQASDSVPEQETTSFEGGEVTGFALTQPVSPPLGPAIAPAIVPTISHAISPVVRPASFNYPTLHHHHLSNHHLPGLSSLASSINSFASPSTPLPGPHPGGVGLSTGLSLGVAPYPAAQPSQPGPAYPPASIETAAGLGEDRHPFDYGSGSAEYSDSHEHHHEHHHEHVEKGHHGKVLSLKDLFDLVLTAIAFLAFGAFAIHVIMCLMLIPQQQNGYYPYVEVPLTANGINPGNGAGEAEGGRRRRRRSAAPTPSPGDAAPTGTSIDVLNRAAQRVLASIDAALLAYDKPARTGGRALIEEDEVDNRDCLRRSLCKHNRFSRTVDGPFRLWMPIWSVGLSWVSGRLDPGAGDTGRSVAATTLDNLRAALLGLGNAKCHIVYPRCSLANRRGFQGTSQPPEGSQVPKPAVVIHLQEEPTLDGDLLSTTMTAVPVASAGQEHQQQHFMPIGVKSNKKRHRRPPYAYTRGAEPHQ